MAYNDNWQDLVQADQYIDQAFANIERQQQIVGELANTGSASLEATRVLETMRSLVMVMCQHREQIAKQLQQAAVLSQLNWNAR